MTLPADPVAPASSRAPPRRRIARRLAFGLLAFTVMTVAAFASLVRFDGPREPRPPAANVAAPAAPAVTPGQLVVPVVGVSRSALSDSWGQARDGGARPHQGIDIMAPGGTPALAAADGVVEKLFLSRAGGVTLYLRSAEGRMTYYYSHLAGYAPGIVEGMRVRAGQLIGYVGDTGNAGAGNTHLHFGVTRMRPGERWWQGEPINPYPLLAGTKANR